MAIDNFIDTSICIPLKITGNPRDCFVAAKPRQANLADLTPRVALRLLDALVKAQAEREGLDYEAAIDRLSETDPAAFRELYQAAYRKR